MGYPEWFKNPKGKTTQRQAANVTKEEREYTATNPLEVQNQQDETSSVRYDGKLINNLVQEMVRVLNERKSTGT